MIFVVKSITKYYVEMGVNFAKWGSKFRPVADLNALHTVKMFWSPMFIVSTRMSLLFFQYATEDM